MSLLQPKPVEQLVPLHGFAIRTLLNDKIGGMRKSAREGETATAPSPYVDPHKEPGALTAKQIETVEDRVRVKDMVKQNSKISSEELLPPPPSGKEMYQLNKYSTKVARDLYEDNPVKVVPYASTVIQAYNQHKTDQGPFLPYVRPAVSLPPLYELYA